MKVFSMRPAFHGYSSSSIVGWYYERAWNTMTGAKRAIVARAVDLYIAEIDPEYRTIKFNLPQDPDDADQFLECNKKNIKIIDDFFADNAVRSKHFRDNMEVFRRSRPRRNFRYRYLRNPEAKAISREAGSADRGRT